MLRLRPQHEQTDTPEAVERLARPNVEKAGGGPGVAGRGGFRERPVRAEAPGDAGRGYTRDHGPEQAMERHEGFRGGLCASALSVNARGPAGPARRQP